MRNGDSQTPPRMLGVDSMGSPSICLKQGLQGGSPGWELPEWFWGSAVQTRHDQTLCLPVGAEPLRRPFCAEPALLSCALLALLCCSGSPVLFWISCAVLCHAVPCWLSCAMLCQHSCAVLAVLYCGVPGDVGTCCRDAGLTSGCCPNPCLVGHQIILI